MSGTKRKSPEPAIERPEASGSSDVAQLDALLTELKLEYKNGGGRYTAHRANDINVSHTILERVGVVGIAEVAFASSRKSMLGYLARSFAELHKDRVPEDELKRWRKEGVGAIDGAKVLRGTNAYGSQVLGNVGFGFVFGQKNPLDSPLVRRVGDLGDVRFEYQPMVAATGHWLGEEYNVRRNVFALGAKVCGGGDDNRKLTWSWDSTKYVPPNPRDGTPKVLTEPHCDIYDNHERTQMAVELGESSRRLCYVPFSNHPRVKALLRRIDARYASMRTGFVSFDAKNDALRQVFFKHAIAFDQYSLAAWAPGIVHFEAFTKSTPAESVPTDGGVRVVDHRSLARGEKLDCIRVIVGTHKSSLYDNEHRMLSAMVRGGFVPSLYRSNKHSPRLRQNLMCAKSTQFHKTRTVTQHEKDQFQRWIDSINVDTSIAAWDQRDRIVYGLE